MEFHNTQLKKGIIEPLVLTCLKAGDKYGYEIIQLLDELSQGIFKMKEGTLYPVLYRLEDNHFIESYWQNVQDKRGIPRKYYKITPMGETELIKQKDEWNLFKKTIDQIFVK